MSASGVQVGLCTRIQRCPNLGDHLTDDDHTVDYDADLDHVPFGDPDDPMVEPTPFAT